MQNVSLKFDLEYFSKNIKHICHHVGQKYNPCLLEVYRLYIGLVECFPKEILFILGQVYKQSF